MRWSLRQQHVEQQTIGLDGRPLTQSPPWLVTPHRAAALDRQWLYTVLVLLAAACVYHGPWGVAAAVVVALAALVTHLSVGLMVNALVRRSIPRTALHTATLGLLLGLSLPMTRDPMLRILAGLLLGVLAHALGRTHRLRIHPGAMAIVLVWVLPWVLVGGGASGMLSTTQCWPAVLRPDHVLIGDVWDAGPIPNHQPWLQTRQAAHDAVLRRDPYLTLRSNQQDILNNPPWLASMLSSGELPDMPTILLGAWPGPLGATCPALLIALGLYLVYRRISHWPMLLAALGGALVTLTVMPVARDAGWSFALPRLIDLDAAAAITFVALYLLTSPMGLIAMFYAPLTMPLTREGRVMYGLLLGVIAMATQWLQAPTEAAFISVVIAGLASPYLDHRKRAGA
jgi:Na+-transporting NADH:ubiquinone oxidoreductase subunit NqrB